MTSIFDRVDAIIQRETVSLEKHLDVCGREILIGDYVSYAVSLGRSAGMQTGWLDGITEKGMPRIRIDERFRKTWGKKPIVTLQYWDRIVKTEEPK